MFCSQCGTQLLDDAKFCCNCGSMVGESNKVASKKKKLSDTVMYAIIPVIFLLWRFFIEADGYVICLLDSVVLGLIIGLLTYFLYNRSFDKIRVVLCIYLGSVLAMYALNEAYIYASYKFYMYDYIFYAIPAIVVLLLNRFKGLEIKRLNPILFNVITVITSFLFFMLPYLSLCIRDSYELSNFFYGSGRIYIQYGVVEIVFSIVGYFLLGKVLRSEEGETK